jgi:hypothetical protein
MQCKSTDFGFVAAIAAISTPGLLTAGAIAQAYPVVPLGPACHGFEFAAGQFVINQDTGIPVTFATSGLRATNGGYTAPGGASIQGRAQGGVSGRAIDITVWWGMPPDANHDDPWSYKSRFTGRVNDDGSASGNGVNLTGGPGSNWTSNDKLKCVVPVAPPPLQAPPPQQAPPPPAMATVTGDVDVYAQPGGVGVPTGRVLRRGDTVQLGGCRSDGWCEAVGIGWVWGEFLDKP